MPSKVSAAPSSASAHQRKAEKSELDKIYDRLRENGNYDLLRCIPEPSRQRFIPDASVVSGKCLVIGETRRGEAIYVSFADDDAGDTTFQFWFGNKARRTYEIKTDELKIPFTHVTGSTEAPGNRIKYVAAYYFLKSGLIKDKHVERLDGLAKEFEQALLDIRDAQKVNESEELSQLRMRTRRITRESLSVEAHGTPSESVDDGAHSDAEGNRHSEASANTPGGTAQTNARNSNDVSRNTPQPNVRSSNETSRGTRDAQTEDAASKDERVSIISPMLAWTQVLNRLTADNERHLLDLVKFEDVTFRKEHPVLGICLIIFDNKDHKEIYAHLDKDGAVRFSIGFDYSRAAAAADSVAYLSPFRPFRPPFCYAHDNALDFDEVAIKKLKILVLWYFICINKEERNPQTMPIQASYPQQLILLLKEMATRVPAGQSKATSASASVTYNPPIGRYQAACMPEPATTSPWLSVHPMLSTRSTPSPLRGEKERTPTQVRNSESPSILPNASLTSSTAKKPSNRAPTARMVASIPEPPAAEDPAPPTPPSPFLSPAHAQPPVTLEDKDAAHARVVKLAGQLVAQAGELAVKMNALDGERQLLDQRKMALDRQLSEMVEPLQKLKEKVDGSHEAVKGAQASVDERQKAQEKLEAEEEALKKRLAEVQDAILVERAKKDADNRKLAQEHKLLEGADKEWREMKMQQEGVLKEQSEVVGSSTVKKRKWDELREEKHEQVKRFRSMQTEINISDW